MWRVIAEFVWFQLQRVFITFLEAVWLYLNGTAEKIREAKDPKRYSTSARVSAVKKWILFDPWMSYNTKNNIISWHEEFVHPEYVLKDEVSLYCMTDDEAWFLEAPEGVEVWKSKYSAFHKIAQHEYAKKVVKMPLSSFYRLAEELGVIKQQLIFIDFVPRSGSTLIGQIFEETGVCVNYSEPHFLNMFWSSIPSFKLRKILRAAITVYCKPRKAQTSAFVFKSAPMGRSLAPIIHELFPDAKLLHLTRNAIPNTMSALKVMRSQSSSLSRLILIAQSFPPLKRILFRKLFEDLNFTDVDFLLNLYTSYPVPEMFLGYATYVQVHYKYLTQHLNAPYKMPAIKYEDFLSSKESNIRKMFEFCGLDANLVISAMKAYEKDSQAGSPLGKDSLQPLGDQGSFPTPAMLKDVKKLAEHFGLGDITEDFRLPGTITSK